MAQIIDIGEVRLQRSNSWHPALPGECDHKHIRLDGNGHIVRCMKCDAQLSAFWALEMLAEQYNRELRRLERDRNALAAAQQANLHLLAARKVEAVWRSTKMAPACPHCGRGILAKDGLGNERVRIEFELRRRATAEAAAAAGAPPQGSKGG